MWSSAIAFNLLVNALFSFVCTLGIVYGVLRLLRVGPDLGHLLLLGLPWLKLVWDLAQGIPESSFFWHKLAGAQQELGSFKLGFGATRFGPLLTFGLGARWGAGEYSQSAAELLDTGLRRVWPHLPTLVVLLTFGISSSLVARRLLSWACFARSRRRLCESTPVCWHQLKWRSVPVYVSAAHRGAPYASGVLRPYIVFSVESFVRLSEAERHAAIQHELSHVRHADTLLLPLWSLLCDVGWFLPGARGLLERWRATCELRADEAAVRAGVAREVLALALLRVSELVVQKPQVSASLGRRGGLLRRRIERLLGAPEPAPRALYRHKLGRPLLVLLVVAGVLQSLFFGNHLLTS
jgi:Zn-dependent protease with chaperone function